MRLLTWLAVLLLAASPLEARSGRYKRSAKERRTFMRLTGYPHGRPGYIIDHVTALKRRTRRVVEYAVANRGRGEGQRPLGIARSAVGNVICLP
ncbi:MAG: hypothetical protein ABIT76_08720 [Chthoniobacterales bacterium]